MKDLLYSDMEYYLKRKGRYYFRGCGVKFSVILYDIDNIKLKYGERKAIKVEFN